jgi:hypothetical protein
MWEAEYSYILPAGKLTRTELPNLIKTSLTIQLAQNLATQFAPELLAHKELS